MIDTYNDLILFNNASSIFPMIVSTAFYLTHISIVLYVIN